MQYNVCKYIFLNNLFSLTLRVCLIVRQAESKEKNDFRSASDRIVNTTCRSYYDCSNGQLALGLSLCAIIHRWIPLKGYIRTRIISEFLRIVFAPRHLARNAHSEAFVNTEAHLKCLLSCKMQKVGARVVYLSEFFQLSYHV